MKGIILLALVFLARCNATEDVVELTETDFDEMIKGYPTFVKFYSPSCPHCMKLAPVWDRVGQVAPTYPQSFRVASVDCAAESLLCERVGVRGVPTLIFFKDGKMYKYKGPREYNDIMKFGAGDFVEAKEVQDLPPPLVGGVVHAAKYTMYKLIKDVHAVIRFNVWVVAFIFFVGFAMGSMVAMIFAMSTFKDPVSTDLDSPPSPSYHVEPEKSISDKKSD